MKPGLAEEDHAIKYLNEVLALTGRSWMADAEPK